MNTGTFAGYLGRDAELRSTPSGKTVMNFSVGVSVGFGDEKKTLWVGCALWGERAEKLHPYLKKGKPVVVTGDIELRTYTTRDNEHGAELVLNVQRVTLIGGKRDDEGQRPAAQRQAPAQQPADFDDPIPF